jgi:hypothetical protein
MTDSGVWKAKIILLMVIAWPVFAFGSSLDADIILQSSPCAIPQSIEQPQSGCIDAGLAAAVQEFLSPPSVASQLPGKLAADVRYLPTVPAAFFMVLWGFICVVFVKDRRLLLVALAAFWWAGQTGVNNIPRLISRIIVKNNKSLSPVLSSQRYIENLIESLFVNKDSQYMGLLRCLNGIPDKNAVKVIFPVTFKQASSRFISLYSDAVNPSQISNSLLKSLVKETEQIQYFSPAFIFNNLARGPPA